VFNGVIMQRERSTSNWK